MKVILIPSDSIRDIAEEISKQVEVEIKDKAEISDEVINIFMDYSFDKDTAKNGWYFICPLLDSFPKEIIRIFRSLVREYSLPLLSEKECKKLNLSFLGKNCMKTMNLFLSNERDNGIIKSKKGKEKIINIHVEAIKKILK